MNTSAVTDDVEYPRETRRLVRAWIRFWYNNWTRVILVLLGGHLLLTLPLLVWMGVDGEARRNSVMLLYFGFFFWAMVDNDYTQLHRIGRDVDGRLLPAAKAKKVEPVFDFQ